MNILSLFFLVTCLVINLFTRPVLAEPLVVASTSWAASFAKAAGVKDVVVVVPENVLHPPDYDPRPSDLIKLRDADYIVLGGFEGFANRLKEAAGGKAKVIQVRLLNSPDNIKKEVFRLGVMFGTLDKANEFIRNFEETYQILKKDLDNPPRPKERAVAQRFVEVWADFLGLEIVGTFGPGILTPKEVARLAALKPLWILDNFHMPVARPIAEATGAKPLALRNFPGPNEGILDVFLHNKEAFEKIRAK